MNDTRFHTVFIASKLQEEAISSMPIVMVGCFSHIEPAPFLDTKPTLDVFCIISYIASIGPSTSVKV